MYDPHVNILRSTTEALAAIISGVDSLHISPFNEVLDKQDKISERIARNTHYILAEEAHLAKHVDPAGGSWFVERLTEQVARQAWQLFQQIEALGGMAQALVLGFPQAQIGLVSARRKENIAKRKDKLVGTNMYTNLEHEASTENNWESQSIYQRRHEHLLKHRQAWEEQSKTRSQSAEQLKNYLGHPSTEFVDVAINMALEGATLGDFYQLLWAEEAVRPTVKRVEAYRVAEPYETLRAAAVTYKRKHGFLPQVFLINLGNPSQYKARAEFSTGFFKAGGFEVIGSDGFDSVEVAVTEVTQSRAAIVTICSSDELYRQFVPTVARNLKKANSDLTIVVAGKIPEELSEMYKQSGVELFIHVNANCYETLHYLQQAKGIVL